jgi:5'-nucleotidase
MIKRTLLLLAVISTIVCAQFNGNYEILVVNDDGYDTTGIRALARAMSDIGKVTIVAPKTNASGVGHGITYKTAIFFGRDENEGGIPVYWVDAKPATCVRWALDTLYTDSKPDLVVSGINRGENTGNAVYYSGTIASARESVLAGVPAIACSMQMGGETDYNGASKFVRDLSKELLREKDSFFFLNVNFPNTKLTDETAVKYTFTTKVRWQQTYEERTNPRNGETYFWIVNRPALEPEKGSDQKALLDGHISITPLQIDLTDYSSLTELQEKPQKTKEKPLRLW